MTYTEAQPCTCCLFVYFQVKCIFHNSTYLLSLKFICITFLYSTDNVLEWTSVTLTLLLFFF